MLSRVSLRFMVAPKKPIIEVKKLNVIYFPGKNNEVHALTDISLEIYPGEFIIFFGPSGCGKSTLLYSISGLERNITGDILVKGDNLRTLEGKKREEFHQKTIGMVFQAYFLIPSLTVLQNVALPQMALNASVRTREERGLMFLKQFGVFEQARKLPTELSGGQQQRVAICRSVINDPDIILADEPVGNLDSKSSEEVMKLLLELNDVQKKTVVLVTHDPSHLHFAHRVFFLRDGHLIRTQVNSPEDRKESPIITAARSSMSAELEEWAKTLGPDAVRKSGAVADLVRSKQLLTEVLTGLSMADISLLEGTIQKLLQGRTTAGRLFHLLHKHEEKGGFGFPKAKAEKWTKEIATLTKELRKLRRFTRGEKLPAEPQLLREAHELCRYVLKQSRRSIRNHNTLLVVDRIVYERLTHVIDPAHFPKKLSLSLKKGGAGFSPSAAHAFARRIEAIIVLNGEVPQKTPEPTPPQPELPSSPADS